MNQTTSTRPLLLVSTTLLQPSQVHTLMQWVVQLFQRYGKAKVGLVALPPGSSSGSSSKGTTTTDGASAAASAARLAGQRGEEGARELRVLLRLLIHVTQRELAEADGGGEDNGSHVDISQVGSCVHPVVVYGTDLRSCVVVCRMLVLRDGIW